MTPEWWTTCNQSMRIGFVFAMRSNGVTLRGIGALIGRSAENVRRYESMATRRINKCARLAQSNWPAYCRD